MGGNAPAADTANLQECAKPGGFPPPDTANSGIAEAGRQSGKPSLQTMSVPETSPAASFARNSSKETGPIWVKFFE